MTNTSSYTLSGSSVTALNDISGNNRTLASVNTPVAYSAAGFNGYPCLNFGNQAHSNYYTAANLTNFNPVSFYMIGVWDGPSSFNNYYGMLSFNFTANQDIFVTNNSGTILINPNTAFLNGSSSSTNTVLPTFQNFFVLIKGTNNSFSANRTNIYFATDRTFTNRGWLGRIVEIGILPSHPTASERDLISGYGAWKCNFPSVLPSGHPYKNSPPTI